MSELRLWVDSEIFVRGRIGSAAIDTSCATGCDGSLWLRTYIPAAGAGMTGRRCAICVVPAIVESIGLFARILYKIGRQAQVRVDSADRRRRSLENYLGVLSGQRRFKWIIGTRYEDPGLLALPMPFL
jgi:hypothetical protein